MKYKKRMKCWKREGRMSEKEVEKTEEDNNSIKNFP